MTRKQCLSSAKRLKKLNTYKSENPRPGPVDDDEVDICVYFSDGSSQGCQSSNYSRLVKITNIIKRKNLISRLRERDTNSSLKYLGNRAAPKWILNFCV